MLYVKNVGRNVLQSWKVPCLCHVNDQIRLFHLDPWKISSWRREAKFWAIRMQDSDATDDPIRQWWEWAKCGHNRFSPQALIHQSRRLERPLRIRSWFSTTWAQLENLTVLQPIISETWRGRASSCSKILRWISYHSYHSYLRLVRKSHINRSSLSKTTMRSLQFHRTCASAFLSLDLGVSIGFKDKHGQTGKRQFLTQKNMFPSTFFPSQSKDIIFSKSSKVDLGPHGLPRIAKLRNPWGLLSHNSLVQLQVCLRLSHGIPWYPQFHEIQKNSQLSGHLEGIYPYLSMYILFSDPYDYCNSTRCAGAGYFQRFLSPPKSVGGMWWIQQIYNDAKDDTFSLNADRNGQEHEQRTCLKIGVPMSPKSDGFSIYPLRLLGSIRAYCTYPFSKRHMLNRNHPAAICKHQRKHSGLFRERNLHKWSETQLGLLDRSTYLTYTPRQCAMKWGH